MCQTYDKSRGGDTRELQSRMVPPQKKLGRVTLRNLVSTDIGLISSFTGRQGVDLVPSLPIHHLHHRRFGHVVCGSPEGHQTHLPLPVG